MHRVVPPDPDAWPRHRIDRSEIFDRCGRVARGHGSSANTFIEVAVRVREGVAGTIEGLFASFPRVAQPPCKRYIVHMRQARMRDGVRPDLPTRVCEHAKLLPRHSPCVMVGGALPL